MSTLEKKVTLRDPLAKAKGYGSAKEGVLHWIEQRVTSIALIPLSIWFVISALYHMKDSYQELIAWIGNPYVAVSMLLFVFALFYHMWLGLQVVVEDYVSHPIKRYITLISIKFAVFFMAILSIFAILKIAIIF